MPIKIYKTKHRNIQQLHKAIQQDFLMLWNQTQKENTKTKHKTQTGLWRVVWYICEPSLPVAVGGSRCSSIDHLQWGPHESHQRVWQGRVTAFVSKDQSISLAAKTSQKINLFSSSSSNPELLDVFIKIIVVVIVSHFVSVSQSHRHHLEVFGASGRRLPLLDLTANRSISKIHGEDQASLCLPCSWKT